MQDIHSIGGAGTGPGNRLLTTGGAAVVVGDRRLRPHNHHHHHHNNHTHLHHQALKCPRCDSLNTKFCYYNNYNLSQPRHFCKSCRRYWTKGGILRNVPVGGGCRKSKRSSSKQSKQPQPTSATTATDQPGGERSVPKLEAIGSNSNNSNYNSNSSSDGSSLTATNVIAAAVDTSTTTNTVTDSSVVVNTGNIINNNMNNTISLNSVGENTKLFFSGSHVTGTNYDDSLQPLLDQPGLGLFTEMGSFTSLIGISTDDKFQFGFGSDLLQPQQVFGHYQAVNNNNHNHNDSHNQPLLVGGGVSVGVIDQTVQVELSDLDHRSGGFESLDWQGSDGSCFFDAPSAVDQAYWSQSQWSNNNTTTEQNQPQQFPPTLYLP